MQEKKFKSIITLNPYAQTYFKYENRSLARFYPLKFSKKNFYLSFLRAKDLIFTTISLSKNIPQEDIYDVLEMRIYEELDLDQAIEYVFDYELLPSLPHEKEQKFAVFISEAKIIQESFEELTKTIPFIDAILPAPTLFKTLYTHDILDNDEIHFFIYFQKSDAFVALYQNGTLLYTKSLKYSFEYIAERISEKKGKEVSANDVMQRLSKEGLKISDLDELPYYMEIFNELFMFINDILIYIKRANEIEHIDKIFIGSEIGFIKGIEEYSQTYLAHKAFDLHFDYGIKTQEPFVEELHYLMALCGEDILERNIPYVNLTLFKRPPPLSKRPSGRLLLVAGISALLALAYPLYNYIYAQKIRFEIAQLKKEYPKIHQKRVELEKSINTLRAQIKSIREKIAQKSQELKKREQILQAIYNKKVTYTMKAATLAELTQDLVAYKLK
ncbi:MAG: hypothetical protein C6H99_05290, partial [Epsilonproteobacteria bacterium]|nr:hypothetical protein [Campylobacterota bacterium]NPA64172.1 hypothetical protein [Campylobacterota bacterium]